MVRVPQNNFSFVHVKQQEIEGHYNAKSVVVCVYWENNLIVAGRTWIALLHTLRV